MGKSTISMAIFNSFLLVYQRVATITSRFVFFFLSAHVVHKRGPSCWRTFTHSRDEPRVARCGQSGIHGVPEILGKTSWNCPGNHYFRWYFLGQKLGDLGNNLEISGEFSISRFFFARLPRIVACNQVRRSLMFLDGNFSGRQEVQGFAIPLTAAFGILQGLSKRPSNPASLQILEGSRRL